MTVSLSSAGNNGAPDTCIRTWSGILFDLADPQPAKVFLRDIAEHLAKINRFTGATNSAALSVAQHAVFVSRLAETINPLAAPYALLHDAEEAYTGDWSSPLKRTFQKFGAGEITERIGHNIRRAIFQRFGLQWGAPADLWKVVKDCDGVSYVTERRDHMQGADPLGPGFPEPRKYHYSAWPWPKAADEFLNRARELGLQEIG